MEVQKEKSLNTLQAGMTPYKKGDNPESEKLAMERNKAKPVFEVRCVNCDPKNIGREWRMVSIALCLTKNLLKKMKHKIEDPNWEKVLDEYCAYNKIKPASVERNIHKLNY